MTPQELIASLSVHLEESTDPTYLENLERAATDAGGVCTATYDSGLQVSGVFEEILCDASGNPIYLRTFGPTQLAYRDKQISGHGGDYHAEGFGSPIGRLRGSSRCLSQYTIEDLRDHGIATGSRVTLEYLSDITVEGILQGVHCEDQRNLILSFTGCTVTDGNGRVLFDPTWGTYDLAVGSLIISVSGGVADG